MADEHLSRKILERFLFFELTPAESTPIINHLLSRCPECQAVAEEVAARFGLAFRNGQFVVPKPPMNFEQAFQLVYARAFDPHPLKEKIAEQHVRARGLWSEVAAQKPEERLAIAKADSRFHIWGFFDRVIEEAREAWSSDPEEAVALATLALSVHVNLQPEEYTAAFLADLRCQALGILGNAKRLAADFEGAAEAFATAQEALDEGSGDPIEEANLISFRASLRADLGYFEEAAELLTRAQELLLEIEDEGASARLHLQQGLYLGYVDPERGITWIREALVLIAGIPDARLELCGLHNLAWFLVEAGRVNDAVAILNFTRPLYRQFGDAWTQLRLHWLEGRIARELGDVRGAVSTFRRTAGEFLKHNMRSEHVLISVDLMEVLVAQERFIEAIALGQRVYQLLEVWQVHPELQVVWYLTTEAVRKRRYQEGAFKAIREYVLRHWHRPGERPLTEH